MGFCLSSCPKSAKSSLYISKNKAKIGDIVLKGNKIVSPDRYNEVKNPEPIGIVIVPQSNSTNGKITMIGLDFMSNATLEGSKTPVRIIWGAKGNIPGMTYYNQVPVISDSNKVEQSSIQSTQAVSYIPLSDEINGDKIPSSIEGYNYLNSATYLSPGPVLEEDKPNPLYRASSYINSNQEEVSIKNPLSDMNGKENTQKILANDTETNYDYPGGKTDYLMAKLCSLYNKGDLKWYLPSCGELGYLMSNLKRVNESRELVEYPPIQQQENVVYLQSSTLFSSDGVNCAHSNGYVGGSNNRNYTNNNPHSCLPATQF